MCWFGWGFKWRGFRIFGFFGWWSVLKCGVLCVSLVGLRGENWLFVVLWWIGFIFLRFNVGFKSLFVISEVCKDRVFSCCCEWGFLGGFVNFIFRVELGDKFMLFKVLMVVCVWECLLKWINFILWFLLFFNIKIFEEMIVLYILN